VHTDAVKLAARVFDVDPPDFLQVRWMREAMANSSTRVTVDLDRPYLDQFRNVRDRALRTEEGEEERKVYVFSETQAEVPFIRVEDAVGDTVDPGEFPRVFRVEYLKDGTIRRYVVTQPGDLLAVLKKPDSARWAKVYGDRFDGWVEGEPGELNPFASALNSVGGVQPGRILVLTYYPRLEKAGSGMECFGVPLLLFAFGMLLGIGNQGPIGAGREGSPRSRFIRLPWASGR
jgi:hypothetical protein